VTAQWHIKTEHKIIPKKSIIFKELLDLIKHFILTRINNKNLIHDENTYLLKLMPFYGLLVYSEEKSMNMALVRSTGIVDKYLPIIESWEPKSNSLFINSMCKELIDYLEKNTTFDPFPHDMRKAKEKKTKYYCENGQSILIDSEGVKLFIQFVKDLHTNEELKVLLKNIR